MIDRSIVRPHGDGEVFRDAVGAEQDHASAISFVMAA